MGLVFSHMPCVSPHRFGINMDLSYVCIKELKKNSMCMCSKPRFWVSKWHFLHELDPSLELFQNNLSYNSSYLRITRDSDPTIILITILMLHEYEYDFFIFRINRTLPLSCWVIFICCVVVCLYRSFVMYIFFLAKNFKFQIKIV